jgi:hypothetical protein
LVRLGAAFGGLIDHPGDRHQLRIGGDGIGQNADGSGDDGQNIVEVVRDAAGQLADGFHFLSLPELGFRGLLFREVAADEEMPPHRLRPCSHPGQRHRVPVPVDIAGLEIAHLPPAPRRAHLCPRAVEIVGMNELERAMSDHLLGPIAQDGHGARADLDKTAPWYP